MKFINAKRIFTVSLLASLSACGGPNSDINNIRLEIIEKAVGGGAMDLSFSPPFGVYIPTPSAIPINRASFDCFAVNLTGPGIGSFGDTTDCEKGSDDMNGRGVGILSDLFNTGENIFLDDVPSGNDRRADVYGLYPSPPDCGGTLAAGSIVGVYYLGGKTFNLESNTTLTITTSFTAGQSPSMACTETNDNILIADDYDVYVGSASSTSCSAGPVDVVITNTGISDIEVTSHSATGDFSAPGGGGCSAPPFTLTPGASCAERFMYSGGTVPADTYYGEGYIDYTYQGETKRLEVYLSVDCT